MCWLCRDITRERQAYPSFAPEDLPDVQAAARRALAAARAANLSHPNSQVQLLGLLRMLCGMLRHGTYTPQTLYAWGCLRAGLQASLVCWCSVLCLLGRLPYLTMLMRHAPSGMAASRR